MAAASRAGDAAPAGMTAPVIMTATTTESRAVTNGRGMLACTWGSPISAPRESMPSTSASGTASREVAALGRDRIEPDDTVLRPEEVHGIGAGRSQDADPRHRAILHGARDHGYQPLGKRRRLARHDVDELA